MILSITLTAILSIVLIYSWAATRVFVSLHEKNMINVQGVYFPLMEGQLILRSSAIALLFLGTLTFLFILEFGLGCLLGAISVFVLFPIFKKIVTKKCIVSAPN